MCYKNPVLECTHCTEWWHSRSSPLWPRSKESSKHTSTRRHTLHKLRQYIPLSSVLHGLCYVPGHIELCFFVYCPLEFASQQKLRAMWVELELEDCLQETNNIISNEMRAESQRGKRVACHNIVYFSWKVENCGYNTAKERRKWRMKIEKQSWQVFCSEWAKSI